MNQKIWLLVLFHKKICPPNGGKNKKFSVVENSYGGISFVGRE